MGQGYLSAACRGHLELAGRDNLCFQEWEGVGQRRGQSKAGWGDLPLAVQSFVELSSCAAFAGEATWPWLL